MLPFPAALSELCGDPRVSRVIVYGICVDRGVTVISVTCPRLLMVSYILVLDQRDSVLRILARASSTVFWA